MTEVNLRSWSEISQASKGLQLNSTTATLEQILARFARLETRLVEHERRVAATLPPLQPEPDPPDATTFEQSHAAQLPRQSLQPQPSYQPPPLYQPDLEPTSLYGHPQFINAGFATYEPPTPVCYQMPHSQPSYMGQFQQPSTNLEWSLPALSQPPYTTHHQQPQLPPPKTYQPPLSASPTTCQQPPLTSAATTTSLLHQNHQLQPPNVHQPSSPYSHQPPPPPNTHQPPTPPYVPPRQTTAAPKAQCHNYPQPPLPYLQQRPQSYRQPPVTAAAAVSLPHQNYQPDGQQPSPARPHSAGHRHLRNTRCLAGLR
ncbi:extensin-like [Salvia hispanica]|uniref:extensin-like n=1 Tax=Salvia hispanica TaxID=49212 RepID=UPI002009CA5B|nr:extensin-like [Salvia hispanica]